MSVTSRDSAVSRQPKKMLDRSTVLSVLGNAYQAEEYQYVRHLALSWLSQFPGDLEINVMLARTMIMEGKAYQGLQVLQKVTQIDPEDISAWKLIAQYGEEEDLELAQQAGINAFILGERVNTSVQLPGWSIIFRNAYRALLEGNLDTAETYIYQGLALNQDHLLGCLIHLKVIRAMNEDANLAKFADLYHSRWPDGIVFLLGAAEARLDGGEEAEAVSLLHQCVAMDAYGQVSRRWWGDQHPYQPLWPESMEIEFSAPMPAAVMEAMGWNLLTARVESPYPHQDNKPVFESAPQQPQKTAKAAEDIAQAEADRPALAETGVADLTSGPVKPEPEWVKSTQKEFEKVARHVKKSGLSAADGRYPIYVILSTRTGLRAKYGDQTMAVIDKEMNNLAGAIKNRPGWGAMVFYPDDIETTGKLGIKTTATIDPWKIKLALADLNSSLAKKGGRIGALLIVGNEQVVPFHSLPNPTDDVDDEVLSDNPYASLDSNYFVPEWPIGRMAGEKGQDAGLLLQQLRSAVKYHTSASKSPKKTPSFSFLITLLQILLRRNSSAVNLGNTIGLTAAVWRRSSLAVFRPVGEGKSLLISPPVITNLAETKKIPFANLGYFNLHGLAETGEWYGQRDPLEISSGPDYPVALSVNDLQKNGQSPKVVFSEACYGGYTVEKTESTSVALRFLSIGASVVVGSSCIAYGAATTPLVGADLLGNLFWSALKDGYTTGDAFLQAKAGMVTEMNRRQGYLDGEDQKTLISFILYGDPLYTYSTVQTASKQIQHYTKVISIKTISDHQTNLDAALVQPVSEKMIAQAKKVVSAYLPGLDQAEIQVNAQRIETEGKNHHAAGIGRRVGQKQIADRTVVIFKRKVQFGEHAHYNFARVTLDREGKLMKLALSR